MTNMRHKSVQSRTARNGRYKAAINPVREMFGCTAMEAAGKIRGVIDHNGRLQLEVAQQAAEIRRLEREVEVRGGRIKDLTATIRSNEAEITELRVCMTNDPDAE